MANKEKLPWDMIEEILSRVSPKSLVRFRTVSKQWNDLLNDKTFINNHKKTFRFILTTQTNFYSVSINPKIDLRELTLNVPAFESEKPISLVDCNWFVLCGTDKGTVVWNPWLNQTTFIEPDVDQTSLQFNGIGYDNDKRRLEGSGYKTLASYWTELEPSKTLWKTYDFASESWDNLELNYGGRSSSHSQGGTIGIFLTSSGVSLNGTLYWVASTENKIYSVFFLVQFVFSTGKFYKFCDLPFGESHHHYAPFLNVFEEDRFSLLKQCQLTNKIEIWVTKNKIEQCRGRYVEWMSIMEVSIPNLPDLVQIGFQPQPSYFIEDKRLVMCSCDENGRAWIYVVEDNKLISKTKLVVDQWPLHCTFFPSLVSLPQGQPEKAAITSLIS